MYILGITGGVGAGKSTLLSYLEKRYGAYTVQADRVSHELIGPQGRCVPRVTELLGKGVLDDQGGIDRRKTADLVFPRPDLLKGLNAILHPAVKEEIRRRMADQESQGRKLFVIEAALLLEDHYDEICHDLWYIYVEDQVRRQRLKQQRGYSDEKITDILKNQQPDGVFREKCGYVVENNGNLEKTYEQMDKRMKIYGFM